MSIEIHGVTNEGIAHCEAKGLGKCFLAYAKVGCEDIMGIGFKENSGYTYIALENGVSICSSVGQKVDYLVTNPDDGEEVFLDNYDEAVNYKWNSDDEEVEEEYCDLCGENVSDCECPPLDDEDY